MKCKYPVTHTSTGRCAPRPCSRDALGEGEYGDFCRGHAFIMKKRPLVEVREGAFCVWCVAPARAFVHKGVTISLCARCCSALVYAIDRADAGTKVPKRGPKARSLSEQAEAAE